MPFFGQNVSVTTVTTGALTTASNPVNSYVVVKALPGNTQVVYVSTATQVTTTNGWPLSAGQERQFDRGVVTDAASLYVTAAATTAGVAFFGV